MRRPPFALAFCFAVFCLISIATTNLASAGEDWKPIDPAALALKAAAVEKDADAEALFWEPTWISTPMSSPEMSKVKRTAQLILGDDGTLEGEAPVE